LLCIVCMYCSVLCVCIFASCSGKEEWLLPITKRVNQIHVKTNVLLALTYHIKRKLILHLIYLSIHKLCVTHFSAIRKSASKHLCCRSSLYWIISTFSSIFHRKTRQCVYANSFDAYMAHQEYDFIVTRSFAKHTLRTL